MPLIMMVKQANQYSKNNDKIIFDFSHTSINLAAAIISLPEKKEIYMIDGFYFFQDNPDYFSILDENSIVYSEKLYYNIFRSYIIEESKPILYRYDYYNILKRGAISYFQPEPSTNYPGQSEFAFKILVPIELKGKDVKIKVEFPTDKSGDVSRCQNIIAKYDDEKDIIDGGYQNNVFEAVRPKEEQIDGFIKIVLHLPGLPNDGLNEGRGDDSHLVCGFHFRGIALSPTG
ncbi:MAG: hypothetical protein LBR53_07465 [Deltaproteobacteria bacterium]|jgi:hypothetical protein|nr:hypothetical protein [Deltaproteobacteria bacterium]